MRTILYLTSTANGYLLQPNDIHPIPKEILADFLKRASKTGNIINRRKTFDKMKTQMPDGGIPGVELKVVSNSLFKSHKINLLNSSQEDLKHFEKKGFGIALVSSGAEINNSFLSENLVSEIPQDIVNKLK